MLDDPAVNVLLPNAVARELLAGPEADPGRQAVEQGWAERIADEPLPPAVLEWSLGHGESAVIAAALTRPGAVAVLDDAEARRCARTLGVPVMGTSSSARSRSPGSRVPRRC